MIFQNIWDRVVSGVVMSIIPLDISPTMPQPEAFYQNFIFMAAFGGLWVKVHGVTIRAQN